MTFFRQKAHQRMRSSGLLNRRKPLLAQAVLVSASLAAFSAPAAADNLGVFRSGAWIVDDRNNGWNGEGVRLRFGVKGDVAMLGDVDGDGRDEVTVYRPRTGQWFFDRENNGFQANSGKYRRLEVGELHPIQFGGLPGDIGLMGNLDGPRNGPDEVVIYRGRTGHWIVDSENDGFTGERNRFQFGGFPGDRPLLADINGDGFHEPVIFRVNSRGQGTWYIDRERNGYTGETPAFVRGRSGDIPVAGDVNGDGRDELGIYRKGYWEFYTSRGGLVRKIKNFGLPTDVPFIGNINGRSEMNRAGGGRGLSCLHCSHPKASASARSIVAALAQSRLERPTINFLIDNHFGYNAGKVRKLINDMGGKYPHVEVYLLNGPGQRRWATNQSNQNSKGFGTNVNPSSFNRLIETRHGPTMNAIRAHFNRALQVCDHTFRKGGRCFVSPALEDNLSNAAVKVLAAEFNRWRSGRPIEFVRNRDVRNSQAYLPLGWTSEVHTRNPGLAANGRNGIVTTDDGQSFPGYCSLKSAADATTKRGGIFVAWNKDLQGISQAGLLPNPDKRNYGVLAGSNATAARQLLTKTCR